MKPATEPNWSACPTLHLTGCPIIPTTTYSIQAEVEGALSAEVLLETQAIPSFGWFGDCVGSFTGPNGNPPNVWTPPNGTVNLDDAVAAIKTLNNPNGLNATHLSVTDIHPALNGDQINLNVNFNDVLIIIAGFQGKTYGQVADPGNPPNIPDLTQCPNGIPPPPRLCPGGVPCALFEWVPVASSGPGTIVGNEITLPSGGQTVTLDLQLSGWGGTLFAPELAAYQATVDSDGYTSGTGDPLNPLGWPLTPLDGAFQGNMRCTVNQLINPNGSECVSAGDCPEGELCLSNSAWVFAGLSDLPALVVSSLNYSWGSALLAGSQADGGGTYDGGTLIIEVPSGARGTYTIDFLDSPEVTFMTDAGGAPITPIETIPALISLSGGIDFISWNAPGGGLFSNPTNWTGGIPGPSKTAVFDLSTSGYTVTFTQAVNTEKLLLGDEVLTFNLDGVVYSMDDAQLGKVAGDSSVMTIRGGTLNVANSLTIGGGGDASLQIEATGIVDVGAQIVVADSSQSSSDLDVAGASVTVDGDLVVGRRGSGAMTVHSGGTVSSDAGIIGELAGASGSVSITGLGSQLTTTGLLTVGGDGTGYLTVSDSAQVFASPMTIGASGIVAGNGMLQANVNNSGHVTPGLAIGTLTINGDYDQSSAGSLTIEIVGSVELDRLAVTGSATLDGTLNVFLSQGYQLNEGDCFEIMTYSSAVGQFATVNRPVIAGGLAFGITYGANSIILDVGPDCNLNSVADAEDLANGVSLDECVDWDAGGGDWSDSANWAGGVVPDNGAETFDVTLADVNDDDVVCLDVDIEIDTTQVLRNSLLDLASPTCVGNLTLAQPGGLVVEGTVRLGPGRSIGPAIPRRSGSRGTADKPPLIIQNGALYEVNDGTSDFGEITVQTGGVYAADPTSGGGGAATLIGDELNVIADEPGGGGISEMTLTQNMVLNIADKVVIKGCTTTARGGCTPPVRGGCTPPVWHIQGDSNVSIGGNLSIGGEKVKVENEDDPPIAVIPGEADFLNDSTNPITIQGNFLVAGQNAACFKSSNGGLLMDGGSAANRGVGEQTFEVAGENLGPMIVDDLMTAQFNFALGSLEISQNSSVVFQNKEKNVVGTEPGDEALYVRTLTLGSGSSVRIDETNLFYETLVLPGAGATVTLSKNSTLEKTTGTCPTSDMPLDEPEIVRKNRYISFDPGNAGALTAIRVTNADTGRRSWVQANVSVNNPSIFPLGPAPHFRDWGDVGVIDVGACDIIPLSTYLVAVMPIGCNPADPVSFSVAQDVETSVLPEGGKFWGDVVGAFYSEELGDWLPPNGVTNIVDAQAAIFGFQNVFRVPPVSWVDLEPRILNTLVNFADVQRILLAFKAEEYPFGCPDDPCQDNRATPCH
ncbi:MAG: hypothetical protein IH987_11360 [Planctomycetes bacterium]|nr:hypothetical protein [Planctomycetota bacterium]